MNEQKKEKREYNKDNFTIVWEASKCIHAGVCVKSLPDVYDPQAKPWIKPANASVEELKKQIDQCPSGALSYYTKDENTPSEIKIHARKNGSLLVEGNLVIIKPDGSVEKREGRATFCRCGKSEKMPFCDGAHKHHSFEG